MHRERKAEFRSEYFRGEMFAMASASANHNLIVLNAGSHLREQLKKKPCRVYPSDLKLRIEATGLYTYPDLSVVCGEPLLESDAGDSPGQARGHFFKVLYSKLSNKSLSLRSS